MARLNWPSKRVLAGSTKVALLASVFTISISAGIRAVMGIEADNATIAIRLVMPFVAAFPIALSYFARLEALEDAYVALMRRTNELAHEARVDPLTGLLNRRAFIAQFELAMAAKVSGVFLIADVDRLKEINDRHGHAVGDVAIVSIAKALTRVLPSESLIARIGGDEFCAFIPQATEAEFELRRDALSATVREVFAELSDVDSEIASASVGAVKVDEGDGFVFVHNAADQRLYGNKRGRYASSKTLD